MSSFRFLLSLLLLAVSTSAHPMGNFSISHYSRLQFETKSIELRYILDFAEIPTLELFEQWGIKEANAPLVEQKATGEAPTWMKNVLISIDGQAAEPQLKAVKAVISEGAGGMSVLRVEMNASVAAKPGLLSFEDRNYASRTGWKEIVVARSAAVAIKAASQSDRDLSRGLTVYPAELTVTPPQDLRASVRWAADSFALKSLSARSTVLPVKNVHQSVVPAAEAVSTTHAIAPIASAGIAGNSFDALQPTVAGTVNRGDFLSHMLRARQFGLGTILIGILVAFGLGAMDALSPGHGKTIVAAYLIGSRGTLKHALFLGLMVTFTHTVSVFALGLGVLFFQKYIVPDQIIPVLGAVSGLSIVGIGAWLLYKRSKALLTAGAHTGEAALGHEHSHHEGHRHSNDHGHEHHHGHAHDHQHKHVHDHAHEHVHAHDRDAVFTHTHSHGGHVHSHVVPNASITLGGLIALGVSGGLVPCPSALVLLLSAIALGHPGLGLALLTGFSCGLALVLMGIGVIVLYAKRLLPTTPSTVEHPLLRLLPVFSSVVVIVLGLLMTLTAVNVIQPARLFS